MIVYSFDVCYMDGTVGTFDNVGNDIVDGEEIRLAIYEGDVMQHTIHLIKSNVRYMRKRWKRED